MTGLPPILSPHAVHARRHLPIWVALAFSAGAVNAVALAACQRFVTHVTGTVTLLAVDHAEPWLVVEYGCVLACFVLGAMTSVLLIDGRRALLEHPDGSTPLPPLALFAAAVAFAIVAHDLGAQRRQAD